MTILQQQHGEGGTKMFAVYKKSGKCRIDIAVFEHEIDAADFCDVRGWELTDENGFVRDLDYREV